MDDMKNLAKYLVTIIIISFLIHSCTDAWDEEQHEMFYTAKGIIKRDLNCDSVSYALFGAPNIAFEQIKLKLPANYKYNQPLSY